MVLKRERFSYYEKGKRRKTNGILDMIYRISQDYDNDTAATRTI